jgi:hypothetical protein
MQAYMYSQLHMQAYTYSQLHMQAYTQPLLSLCYRPTVFSRHIRLFVHAVPQGNIRRVSKMLGIFSP